MRLLLAEDERSLSEALVAVLEHNNYSVDAVYDGAEALAYACGGNYDAVLLDIMMPKLDGLSVLRGLRTAGISVPVLMLTAKGEAEDKIDGLDAGADDYLPKPFVMEELLARIRALTRRKGEYTQVNLTVGNTTLSRLDFMLVCGGRSVRLSGKEFQMLEYLMTNPRQVISTEQFISRIWGFDTDVEINVIWVNLSNIRKKITEIGSNLEIRAVRGVGYLLEARE